MRLGIGRGRQVAAVLTCLAVGTLAAACGSDSSRADGSTTRTTATDATTGTDESFATDGDSTTRDCPEAARDDAARHSAGYACKAADSCPATVGARKGERSETSGRSARSEGRQRDGAQQETRPARSEERQRATAASAGGDRSHKQRG